MHKLRIHLVTMGRWFALPWFAGMCLLGSVMAGGSLAELKTWLAFIATSLLMASCHAQNSLWDWQVGLDQGDDRSVEKQYSGGCGVIASGQLSVKEVVANAVVFAALGLVVTGVLVYLTGWPILVPAVLGLAVPYVYTRGKFSFYHETALAAGVILSAVLGMLAIDAHTAIWKGILVAIPSAITLSYMGLAVDEFPDAEANLKKGVKSMVYRVFSSGFDLSLYVIAWVAILYIFQVFLITQGLLRPLTAITFILVPFIMARLVSMHGWANEIQMTSPLDQTSIDNFSRQAKQLVLVGMLYPILTLVGQVIR